MLEELNLVSKCRQMNKLYCEIIKIRGNYGKKKKKEILRVEITDTRKSLHHRYIEKFTMSLAFVAIAQLQ